MANALKFKIAISGAAETEFLDPGVMAKVQMLGRLIAEHGMIAVTGATTGAPFWAAKAAKEAGGIVIGISPAATKSEHVNVYKLPTEYHDLIIYTGAGYSGRNLLFTRSADAMITVAGRIGTLNEFTDGFEDGKIQAVLTGTGGTTDDIEKLLIDAHRGTGKVIFDNDPKALFDRMTVMLEQEEKEFDIE